MRTMTLWDGTEVPRIGVGCWAIGGAMRGGGVSHNYGDVDDAASLAGLRAAHEIGARLFDTAAAYGGGHSERLLGAAFGGRDDVVIVTKFGHWVDPDTREGLDIEPAPDTIRASIETSLRNLRRDRIDLALFHVNEFPPEKAGFVFDTLGELREEGLIGAFGWSTDYVDSARAFAGREGFVAVENDLNVFHPAEALMAFVAERGLVSINRLPLAMGLLSGKYSRGETVGANDLRGEKIAWMKFFRDGRAAPEFAARLELVRELLTTGGRSLAQGALGWILARSPHALPVPGFKAEAQVRDNLGALDKGPLPAAVMAEIDAVLAAKGDDR